MTAACDEYNGLITTSLQAWVRVQNAWTQALSDVWLVVQDISPVEKDVLASNQTEVDIPAQPNDTNLVMSTLTLSGSPPATIGPDRVVISPSTVPAGMPTTVVVTVVPQPGTPGGTYQGTVNSVAGSQLALAFLIVNAPA